jgi:spore germination cell wall hydrolase CwlJ-like protein
MLLPLACLLLAGGGPAWGGTPLLQALPVALSAQDRDALGRLAYAEAGNQGASGLAGVVFAVFNRLASGRFGDSIQQVIDAPGQFEPVQQTGGSWRDLPLLNQGQSASFETILDLILEGRLPDPTKGALFFQNPAIVASREAAGTVSPGLKNFGGTTPVAIIRDHAFYDQVAPSYSTGAGSRARTLIYRNRVLRLDIQRTDNGAVVIRIRDTGGRIAASDRPRTHVVRPEALPP